MALICPRCQRANFPDAKQCYACAAAFDAQGGDQSTGWSPPAQDSFQRGTASFGRDWRAASDAPTQDRADAFLSQHAPSGARKTDTRHLLLHPLTSSPVGLLALLLVGGIALGALWPAPKDGKRAAGARPAAQQTTGAQASEERDIFEDNERDRRRRERRARRATYHKPDARSAFRPSSR